MKLYMFAIVLVIALVGAALYFTGNTGHATYQSGVIKAPTYTPRFYTGSEPMPCEALFGCPNRVPVIGAKRDVPGFVEQGKYYNCLCENVLALRDMADAGELSFKKNFDYECLYPMHIEKKGYEPGVCSEKKQVHSAVTPALAKGDIYRYS